MGFESAAFKLSYEMTELLDPGNTRNSATFLEFQEICVRGYLAVSLRSTVFRRRAFAVFLQGPT